MTQLPNTAKISEIITALQGLTGVNQKVELVAKLAAKGYTLTGNESMVELVAIVGSANLIDTTTAAGATAVQIMNGRVGFVNGTKVTGNNANLVDTTTGLSATATQILAGREGFSNGAKVVGNMPNRGAVILTPSTVDQLIALGFHDGTGKVIGDSDLMASNIRNGINIFGVVGNVIAGKRFANGSGSFDAGGNFTVSGLAFKPTVIILSTSSPYQHRYHFVDGTLPSSAPAAVNTVSVASTGGTNTSWSTTTSASGFTATNSGFASGAASYLAIE